MFRTGLEKELALEEIAHAHHLHLDERLTVVDALRHDYRRIACIAVLMGYDGLACALNVACRHSCLQVDGGCGHGVVDVYLGGGGHVALEVLTLYQANLQFAHDVLEGESYGRIRSLDVLGCGEEKVARLVSAESGSCLLGALVGAYAERLVGYARHILHVRIVGVGIVRPLVPIQRATGFPFVAVEGERLVVHQIACQLQRFFRVGYVQTDAVAKLEVGGCGAGLPWIVYDECHGFRLRVLRLSRFQIVAASRQCEHYQRQCDTSYYMVVHKSSF